MEGEGQYANRGSVAVDRRRFFDSLDLSLNIGAGRTKKFMLTKFLDRPIVSFLEWMARDFNNTENEVWQAHQKTLPGLCSYVHICSLPHLPTSNILNYSLLRRPELFVT